MSLSNTITYVSDAVICVQCVMRWFMFNYTQKAKNRKADTFKPNLGEPETELSDDQIIASKNAFLVKNATWLVRSYNVQIDKFEQNHNPLKYLIFAAALMEHNPIEMGLQHRY